MKVLLFVLLASSIAAQCNNSNCLSCMPDGTTCRLCDFSKNYTVSEGNCVQSQIDNCSMQFTSEGCVKCSADYFPSQGNCTAVTEKVTNCVMYSDDKECGMCQSDYYLSSNQCVAVTSKVPNCAIHYSATQCAICAEGFRLKENQCVPVSLDNCSVYGNYQCQSCPKNAFTGVNMENLGEFLIMMYGKKMVEFPLSNLCQENTDLNCIDAIDSKTCKECKMGYFPENGVCQQITSPIHRCIRYTNATTCAACEPNHYLSNNTCVWMLPVDNCLSYNSTSVCRTCNEGFFTDNGNCTVVNITVPNCLFYTSDGYCRACEPEYFVVGGVCLNREVANCTKYNEACEACEGNRYYAGGICVDVTSPLPNCVEYSSETQCRKCAEGFYNSIGECVAIGVPNCIAYDSDLKCTECDGDHYLTPSKTCTAIASGSQILNCNYHLTATTCKFCGLNNYLADNGSCVAKPSALANCAFQSASGCIVCSSGHFWDSTSNTCAAVTSADATCFKYSDATTCEMCVTGKFMSEGTCTDVVSPASNCHIFGTTSQECLICNENYYLLSGVCTSVVSPVENCLYHLTAGTCQICKENYYLKDANTCVLKTVPNCASYTKSACNLCNNGYYLNNGACTAVPATITNCFYYADSINCHICISGFTFIGGACMLGTPNFVANPPIQNCAAFSDDAKTCSSCKPGFYLNSNACQEILASIDDCVAYSDPTTCSACDGTKHLKLKNNTCMSIHIEHCFVFEESSKCVQCLPGYVIIDNFCWPLQPTQRVPNCNIYNGPGMCGVCKDGYHRSGDLCALLSTCAEQKDETTCAVCVDGYYLSENGCVAVDVAINKCEAYTSATVCSRCAQGYALGNAGAKCFTNCISAGDSGCEQCIAGKYPVSGECVDVPSASLITDCQMYLSVNSTITCSACSPLYAFNGTHCVSVGQSMNCDSIIESMHCLVCEPGYYPLNGKCVATALTGMQNCTYLMEDTDTKCEMCEPGTYQSAYQGQCLTNNVVDGGNSTNTVDGSGNSIEKLMVMMTLLLLAILS